MKRILILALTLCAIKSNAQQDTLITYTDVVHIDSSSKSDLYDRAKLWVANSYKDSKRVIQLDDKETGRILTKGNFTTFFKWRMMGTERPAFGHANFTMDILIKDGKYKATIYNISFKSDENTGGLGGTITSSTICPVRWPMVRQSKMDDMYADLKKHIDIECKATLIELKEAMQKKIETDF